MPSQQGFFISDSQHYRPIHPECFDGGTTRRCLSSDMSINPIEVFVPLELPGMVQRDRLTAFEIQCVLASGFVQRA